MKSATPPKLAAWLLHHQVRGYRAESLAGDLTEEYAHGRGDAWYWSQVLRALTTSYHRALRLHGLRLLAALAVGWCGVIVGIAMLAWGWTIVQHGLSALSGILLARQPRIPQAFHDVAWILLAACLDLGMGRLVVRVHQTHPRLVAGAFALSILAYRTPFIYGGATAAIADPKQTPLLVQAVLATLLWMTCAWLGGLWQRQADINSTKR